MKDEHFFSLTCVGVGVVGWSKFRAAVTDLWMVMMDKYHGEVISLVIVFSGQSHDLSIWARPGGCLPSPHMCLHEHASCKTIVFQLAHKLQLMQIHDVCVCVCVRFPGCRCCQEKSVFLVTLSSTEFTARELSGMWCLGFQKALDALFFQQQSQYLSSMAYKPAVYVVYMQNQTLTAPTLITVSVLCIRGNKILSLWFSFRVTSKMSTKTHSQLFLKTSKFALSVNLSCISALC